MFVSFLVYCCDGVLHMTSDDFGSYTSKELDAMKRIHPHQSAEAASIRVEDFIKAAYIYTF